MQMKLTNVAVLVLGTLLLGGCNSDKIDHAKDKVEAGLHHAGDKIEEGARHTGDKLEETGHKIESSVRQEVQRAQDKLTENAEKESLRQLGLDEADIDYVIKHSPEDAMAVANQGADNLLFQTKYNFVEGSGQKGGMDLYSWNAPLNQYYYPNTEVATDYQDSAAHEGQAKSNLNKILGRVAFVINSPKFVKLFNGNTQYLESSTFYQPPQPGYGEYPNIIKDIPDTYADFKAAVNTALVREHNSYKLYAVKDFQGGDARGDVGQLSAYFKLKGMANSTLKASAPLVLHELTHTFGYQHAASNQDTVIMQPNNIPYLVQLMTMDSALQSQYQGDMLMFSNSVRGKNQIQWYAGESMFSGYFGND
ncbi:hypothetical protein JCM19232_929 [Vibrio ishigakensis]|uniref:Uncharacterized protein n=1 Tax=Vibrio ishigakensis TaxID=1481914 RepID=A0A0B8PNJ6_9VIBR|nr:hypothetical protein JCM19232_929 [Vibrio ishigakensis]